MAEALKEMYNRGYLDDLAVAISDFYPPFDGEAFSAGIFDGGWEERALKERMRHITLTLRPLLPDSYREALTILRQAAPTLSEYGFENMIFPDFVELYGLDDWQASLPALEQFTQLISAEFAVRPFIVQDQERMMAQMLAWTDHEHEGVRRLASEGSRPRLPWGIALPALQADPSPILPILERLKDDPSESVRRSVANNLNDISKDHPGVVIDLLRRWQEDENSDQVEIEWITSQALRTLVKKGHPGALELLGYSPYPAVEIRNLKAEPEIVSIGHDVDITFEIASLGETKQKLMVDYVVYLMRANGRQTPKVFKLAKKEIAPGETIPIRKKHSFQPVTTRKYYPGQHAVEIQINGRRFGRRDFVVSSTGQA